MITPNDIRARALKLWESQKVQRAYLAGETLFPWSIPVTKPTARSLAEHFPHVREAIGLLRKNSKEPQRHGYRVEFQVVNHRQLGNQSLPKAIVLDSLEDFLHLSGKEREFERFCNLSTTILAARPELRPFLSKRPSMVLEYAKDWDRLLATCRYFQDHPKPNLYLRQLDIPGVHTKFIETHRGILADLLEALLPPEAIVPGVSGLSDHGFERRFGLRVEVPSIRFRLLDTSCAMAGLSDVSIPVPDFRTLSTPVRRVFITENKMNGLCFPQCREAMAVFGLGYGVGCLADIPWLHQTEIFYWGDIDTHGFAILDQLRDAFPRVRSLLMDEKTLFLFKELWGREQPSQRFMRNLTRLTPDENALFEALRDNRWGDSVRLEQEHIAFSHVHQAIAGIG